MAIVCGGTNTGADDSSDCYYYNELDGSWTQMASLNEIRKFAASTFIQGQWWITGGSGPFGKHFTPYLDLPAERFYHNMVQIDENRSLLIGGEIDYNQT